MRFGATVPDQAVRNFWSEFDQLNERDAAELVSSVRNKIDMLVAGPLRNLLGQVEPTIDFRRIIDEGNIFV